MTDIHNKTKRLRGALLEAGACLVGFVDLSCLDPRATKGYAFGIAFALQYDLDVVDYLPNDELWIAMKARIEDKAKNVYAIAKSLLDGWGYHYTRISSGIPEDNLPDLREEFPQKTVATLAGLGWIGKSSLLVTPDYGPRMRLGAMLTGGCFRVGSPVFYNNCNNCNLCVDVCLVRAIKGANWSHGIDRSDLLDAELYNNYVRKRNRVCGLCLKACPIG